MPRNIKVFLATEAIAAGFRGFILPIYVLYFRYYQVTLFQVALLAAIFEATVLIAEIPTGLLADRFGRKLSVTAGFLLFALSGLVFIAFRHLAGFIVAEVLFGLGEAFISGAAEALAVDSIPPGDKESWLRKMYSWRSRIRIAVTTLVMMTAGYLFSQNVSITFYPVLVGGLAGLGISLFFVPVDSDYAADRQASWAAPLGEMVRRIKLISILRVIFILSLAANFAFEAADQYWQVLLSELFNVDVKYFGFLTAAGAVMAFASVGPCLKRFSGGISLPLFILLLAGIVISSLPNLPAAALPFLLILYFAAKELVGPLFSIAINSAIGPAGRATFLSGYNLTCSIGEVGAGLMVGLIASRVGLPAVFVIGGGFLVLVIITVMFSSRSILASPRSEA